jgi:glyceraldehyde-3-phosphate dehydrogenase [NAD(P)+]
MVYISLIRDPLRICFIKIYLYARIDSMAKDLDLRLSSSFDEIFETDNAIPNLKMLIDGTWRASENKMLFDIVTPIDGSVVARAQLAGPSDIVAATRAAKTRRAIKELPAIERIEIFSRAASLLERHKSEFIRVLQLEAGKTAKDAESELAATVQRLRLTMEEAGRAFGEYIPGDWSKGTVEKMALVIREPVGVVLAIVPFNYPLFIAAAKIVPALLSGNSVVIKPSSYDPISAALLVRLLEEAGIPHSSMNLVTGTGSKIGDALITSAHVDMVNFTGSTPVGKRISQMAALKKLHLELGGKSYALIMKDANLDFAAERCVFGSLKYSGQRCDAVSAILVVEEVAEPLVEKITSEVDKWHLGDPRMESVAIGPVINSAAAQSIHKLVMDAVEKGAKLVRGGKFNGSYYEPTVLDYVPRSADIASEEVFGPVITIIRCKNEDDALRFARQSRYGLESCVFTRDFYKMWRTAMVLECGEVTINDCPSHGTGYFPFGGLKDSGLGREGVGYGIYEMTNTKTIVFNLDFPEEVGKEG